MNTSKKPAESVSEIKRQRTASRNAVIVMALLFIALLAGSTNSSPNGDVGTGDVIWGSLSTVAFAGLLWSLYISYKQADERQQLIQLKANSLAFVAIIFSTVVAQILHAIDVLKLDVSIPIIVVGGILSWTILLKAAERRNN